MIRSILLAAAVATKVNGIDLEQLDGFESERISTTGNVEVSSEVTFLGPSAFKFTGAGGGYNRNFISVDITDTPYQQEMYGRMMVWVDGGLATMTGDFTMVQADGPPKPESGAPANTNVMYRYRVSADGAHNGTLFANYDTWVDENPADGQTDWLTDCWDHDDVQLPREEWSCVEWRFNAQDDELQYWLNGEELDGAFVQGTGEGCVGNTQNGVWYGPSEFTTVHIGVEQYMSFSTERTLYVDDFVLDTEQVGCPSA